MINNGHRNLEQAASKACTDPTRLSGTLPKYDIKIQVAMKSQPVGFGEGWGGAFFV